MFKKILAILCLLLTFSSYSFAHIFDPMTTQRLAITDISPYFGINGGYDNGPWKVKSSEGTNFPTYGGKGGLFAGVSGRICPGLYLAGELFGNKDSTHSNYRVINDLGTLGKIKVFYDYGLSVISGYMFAPSTILYGRMGVIVANFSWTQQPGLTNLGRSTSTHNVYGGQFGFGLQQALLPHLYIRAEYDYSTYQSRVVFENKIYPQNNQYNLGLLYKFC